MSTMTMDYSYVQMLFWKMRGFEAHSDGNRFIEWPLRCLCVYLFQETKSTNDVITQPLTIPGTNLRPCCKSAGNNLTLSGVRKVLNCILNGALVGFGLKTWT